MARNVTEAVDPPRVTRADVRDLAPSDLARILAATAGSLVELPAYLAAACGLRRGEILALRWSCVDFDRSELQVRESLEKRRGGLFVNPPKTTKSRRTVRIPGTVVALLRKHRTEQLKNRMALGPAYNDRDFVVSKPDGSPVDPAWLSKSFTRLARACGIDGAHFHSLRHTAASTMLRLGVNPKVVGEMLGHSTTSITRDVYSHVTPTLQEDAAQRMDITLRSMTDGLKERAQT